MGNLWYKQSHLDFFSHTTSKLSGQPSMEPKHNTHYKIKKIGMFGDSAYHQIVLSGQFWKLSKLSKHSKNCFCFKNKLLKSVVVEV